jgi:subtilase family serine protease
MELRTRVSVYPTRGEPLLASVFRRGLAVLGAVAVVPLAGTATATAAGATAADRVDLPGAVPAFARTASPLVAPAIGQPMTVRVALRLRDATGAEAQVPAVTDPTSSKYGQYLTPAQFNARYAPGRDAVSRVSAFLRSSGLTVTAVAAGNRWVAATGSAGQVNAAFATTVRTYAWHGRRLRAPATTPSIPASIAADVLAVSGLSDAPAHTDSVAPQHAAGPAAAATSSQPCSTYWNEHQQRLPEAYGRTMFPTLQCGYTARQLRGAYGIADNVARGRNGHGVTVGIIGAFSTPTILADANATAAATGEPRFAPGQFRETVFPQTQDPSECANWALEESLDVEAVHGLAPGATVHYFGAPNCNADGIDLTINYVVQNHAADLVSNSYSYESEDLGADEIALQHSFYLQAALEGIGFYFSSGDHGDADFGDGPQPGYAGSDPLVTGVGGASLAVDAHNRYLFETGWGDTFDEIDNSGPKPVYMQPLPGPFFGGAGGGVSTLFSQPFYQRGRVPNSLATSRGGAPMRVEPDVAADGDPFTGFSYGQTVDGVFSINPVAGTSLACPLIVGLQADASTYRHRPIGFANPLMYRLGSVAFRDITAPSRPVAVADGDFGLATFDHDSTLPTTRGFDQVTGLGTPFGDRLLALESLVP